jgi:hypothetical protein
MKGRKRMPQSNDTEFWQETGGPPSVDEACIDAADEILYKLTMLKRERIALINLARERTKEGLPLNSAALLGQAERINSLLNDEAIRELFLFLRASTWAQNRLNAEFRQGSFVIASLGTDESGWSPQDQEEFSSLKEPSFQQLLTNINTR